MPLPGIPSNFLVQQGNGNVFLSWDIIAGATSYAVNRSIDGVNFTLISSPTSNSYLDTTATINTQYYYQVATNITGQGQSPFTPPQSIVPTQPGIMTLGQVRLYSQQRADRVNSQFVTTTEWNSYINQSYFELYDLLVTVYEEYYLAPPAIILTNGQVQMYQLPDGETSFLNQQAQPYVAPPFYKLWGVDVGLAATPASNAWFTLRKFDAIQRNQYVYPQINSSILGVFNMAYRLAGNQIWFIPTPSGNQYIRLWYIPRVATLLQDTDVLDGISGWTEYVITDAAIKALQKEESDVTVLAAQKMMLKQRIEESGMNRDVGQSDTISDVRRASDRNGWFGFGMYDGSMAGF